MDDSTPYINSPNIQTVLNNLLEAIEKYCSTNYFVANADKGHLLITSKKAIDIQISDAQF